MIKKWIKRVIGLGLLGMAALQLTNPAHTNPPVKPGRDMFASNSPPPAIARMVRDACYNCHSSETVWPWYSHIAPFSWRISEDVVAARNAMNFSDWPNDRPSAARKRWRHIASVVEDGEMPLPAYALIHSESRLTEDQRKQLVAWARQYGE